MKTACYIFFLFFNTTLLYSQKYGNNRGNLTYSAALEIESTSKGFLLPRISQQQMLSIQNPAEGLMIYCTDCNPIGIYLLQNNSSGTAGFINNTEMGNTSKPIITSAQTDFTSTLPGAILELKYTHNSNGSGPILTTNYKWYMANDKFGNGKQLIANQNSSLLSIDSSYKNKWICGEVQISGQFSASIPVISEYIPAYFDFNDGTNTYTYSATRGDFDSNNDGVGDAIWLDRNLGAQEVATTNNTNQSTGYLYQWGRYSDGHQIRTSVTSNDLASNSQVESTHTWYSKFIINSTVIDWLSNLNNILW
jgi:hypothetical protein